MDIIRRLGSTPQQRGSLNNGTCPDVFEIHNQLVGDGDLAIIGTDATDELRHRMPDGITLQPHDKIIIIDQRTIADAVNDLHPDPDRRAAAALLAALTLSIALGLTALILALAK